MIKQRSFELPSQTSHTARSERPASPGQALCSSERMTAVRQALRQVARLRANEQKALGYDEEELFNELLRRLGTDPMQAALRMVAGKCSSLSLVQLIELGAKIDAPDGATGPLHAAAFRAREDHLRILLAANADPNRKDQKGRTPLHLAALVKHPEGIRLLAAAGARVNARDAANRTPLHYACASDYGFRRIFATDRLTATIRMLLLQGSRLSLKDAWGRTAWQSAAFEKSRDELLAHLAARRPIAQRSSTPAGLAA